MSDGEEAEEQLAGLEAIVDELAAHGLTPDRKAEIEDTLMQFKGQHHAWYLVMDFLRLSNNDHALFYSASVLEHVIEEKWESLEEEDQTAIHRFLVEFLENNFEDCKYFVRVRLVLAYIKIGMKAGVDNGSFEDFVHALVQWSTSASTKLLGLVSIKTLAEESIHALRTPQVQALKHMLPDVLSVLLDVLQRVLEEAQNLSMIGFQRRVSRSGSPSNSAPRASPSDEMLQSTVEEEPHSLHFNSRSVNTAVTCLEAIGLFFAWVPLTDLLNERLFDILRQYSRIFQPDARIGASAMRCFNEIHAKKHVPPHLHGYVDMVFDMAEAQLMHILQGIKNNAQLNQSLDEDYVDAFIEFLRLFAVNYLSRLATTSPNISDALDQMMLLANSVEPPLFLKMLNVFLEITELFIYDETGVFVEMKEQFVTHTQHIPLLTCRSELFLSLSLSFS